MRKSLDEFMMALLMIIVFGLLGGMWVLFSLIVGIPWARCLRQRIVLTADGIRYESFKKPVFIRWSEVKGFAFDYVRVPSTYNRFEYQLFEVDGGDKKIHFNVSLGNYKERVDTDFTRLDGLSRQTNRMETYGISIERDLCAELAEDIGRRAGLKAERKKDILGQHGGKKHPVWGFIILAVIVLFVAGIIFAFVNGILTKDASTIVTAGIWLAIIAFIGLAALAVWISYSRRKNSAVKIIEEKDGIALLSGDAAALAVLTGARGVTGGFQHFSLELDGAGALPEALKDFFSCGILDAHRNSLRFHFRKKAPGADARSGLEDYYREELEQLSGGGLKSGLDLFADKLSERLAVKSSKALDALERELRDAQNQIYVHADAMGRIVRAIVEGREELAKLDCGDTRAVLTAGFELKRFKDLGARARELLESRVKSEDPAGVWERLRKNKTDDVQLLQNLQIYPCELADGRPAVELLYIGSKGVLRILLEAWGKAAGARAERLSTAV